MKVTPIKEVFRWSFRKKGTQVLNLCKHMFLFSGSLLSLMAATSTVALATHRAALLLAALQILYRHPKNSKFIKHRIVRLSNGRTLILMKVKPHALFNQTLVQLH